MEAWRQYQEDAAAYFRSTGLQAETDVAVRGIRSQHNIDVLVQFRRAGMDHLWIVECKDHARPITKDRALLLRQIVDDVGADKGILLAENGFQSGAREVIRTTNTLVTSLATLRESADDEILDTALFKLNQRVRAAQKRLHSLTRTDQNSVKTTFPTLSEESWPGGAIGLMGFLGILETGIKYAADRDFPAPYSFSLDGERVLTATRSHFVQHASCLLVEIEKALSLCVRA